MLLFLKLVSGETTFKIQLTFEPYKTNLEKIAKHLHAEIILIVRLSITVFYRLVEKGNNIFPSELVFCT